MTTATGVEIKSVGLAEADHAVGVITAAFIADPIARWFWNGADEYLRYFPRFTRLFGGAAFASGSALQAENFAGAALWFAPNVHADDEELAEYLKRAIAPYKLGEVFEFIGQMDEFHPKEPHWYLPMIGVDPARQGLGIGGAIMEQALERCDRDGWPAYLESSNPRNISLYERHGFEIIGRIQAGSSPVMAPMLRQPKR